MFSLPLELSHLSFFFFDERSELPYKFWEDLEKLSLLKVLAQLWATIDINSENPKYEQLYRAL